MTEELKMPAVVYINPDTHAHDYDQPHENWVKYLRADLAPAVDAKRAEVLCEYDASAVGKTPQGEILYAIGKNLDHAIRQSLTTPDHTELLREAILMLGHHPDYKGKLKAHNPAIEAALGRLLIAFLNKINAALGGV